MILIARPYERKYVAGFMLLSVAGAISLLRAISIIPPSYWPAARIVSFGMVIAGGVLTFYRWMKTPKR